MTLTFDVHDLATRLPEMLAEVEAGNEVLIARGSEPVAHVKRAGKPRTTPRDVIESIFEIRKDIPPTTAEEILAWRDEGRRGRSSSMHP